MIDFDADRIAALTTALRITLEMPDATWETLLVAAPIEPVRRTRLLLGNESSLDELVTELNEHRCLDVGR